MTPSHVLQGYGPYLCAVIFILFVLILFAPKAWPNIQRVTYNGSPFSSVFFLAVPTGEITLQTF